MSAAKRFANGSLKDKLVHLIRLKGPLSVSEYMKIALTNPGSGFYMNNDVFGVKGHFTTNPEISQMFGEVLAAWIYQEWKRFNCPKPLNLVEFGPGRGTLMSDVARTLSKFDMTKSNMNIGLIELSPKLKEIQETTLSPLKDIVNNTKWFTHIENVDDEPEGFTAYIAHEFLDALPINKFVKDPRIGQWRELLIDYDAQERLRFCISKKPSLAASLLIPEDFPGDHIEVCPEGALQLQKVADKLNQTGKGCMLICDYGFEEELETPEDKKGDQTQAQARQLRRSNRDTFRAFKNHESWPPLQDPGDADLTADVDFGFLKKQLDGKVLTFGSVTQSKFLLDCGIQARLQVLLQKAGDKEKEVLLSEADMMVNYMGSRYRFLAMFPKDCGPLFNGDPPAGFGEDS